MKCCRHGFKLDQSGRCSKCEEFRRWPETEEGRKHYILSSIIRTAEDDNVPWREIENVHSLAKDVGLKDSEIDDEVEEYNFRFRQPIFELTKEQQDLIDKMKSLGLVVERHNQGPWRQGFLVYKPENVKGNTRPGFTFTLINFDGEDEYTDAPMGHFFPDAKGKWYFQVLGPEPGDFLLEFESFELVVEDVIDYYFGDNDRVAPKEFELHWKHIEKKMNKDG